MINMGWDYGGTFFRLLWHLCFLVRLVVTQKTFFSIDKKCCYYIKPWVSTCVGVMFIAYMIFGITGNALTIVALLRCPRVRNVTAAFIISLCVADFLFCILVLPWEVSRFVARRWLWGNTGWICTIFPLIKYWNVAVSLLSIAMITINRYIMIAHFSIYKSVYRKGWIVVMIAFCWLFALMMLVPTLMGRWGRFGFDSRLQTCSIIGGKGRYPKQILFAIAFLVPAIIIVICYSLIFAVIHKSEKRMREHGARNQNGSSHNQAITLQSNLRSSSKTTRPIEKEARRKRNEWRITKMVLIIFLTFLITYLPITLVKGLDEKVNYPGAHLLGYILIYISSFINPVIYVIMNRQYRQAYKTVLLCRRPRLLSLTSSQAEREKARQRQAQEDIHDKTLMSAVSMSENQMPECHELPEVFTDN
ncbi:unnamed protein product [Meganyctiphanes norvegica]|uniref:G-protein coupled receptors family 1 profile domain-containing protein n=1 Tax=Meganyctiphanes norvegica TaxID=48144 RepID=A0AAV2R3Y6_MEGNR